MIIHASAQNHQVRHSSCYAIARGVAVCLLLADGVWLSVPTSAWASVYKCIDQTGRSVLTNRKAGFQSCRVILEDPAGESKSAAGKKPKNASAPTNDDMAPAFIDSPPLPNDPTIQWMDAPPGGATSPRPCSPGFNPLNPMSTAPCPQSDEAQSPATMPPR